ncbi:MAG: transketolase [Anaerolineae bacterium]|nr:transketolase [Anaerolineae bacterium]MEB2287712.1 transketolase [Anaerolineae bacterium]
MHHHSESLIRDLQERARQIRLDVLDMVYRRAAGHPGGSFSCAEMLAALYFHHLKIDPARPDWPERDRFLLSKGHAAAALYSALAQRGFFPTEDLERWGHVGAHLQGHPDRLKTPGVEMSSGFLGHGLSVGVGLALAQRLRGPHYHTYVMMSDGDMQSGVAWEGALAASKFRASEVTVLMDYNGVQLDGAAHDIMPLEPLVDKWRAFGFAVLEINGHNLYQVLDALDTALEIHSMPTVIVAHTTKGKGVSFMENTAKWHGAVPSEKEYAQARAELKGYEA